MHEEVILHQTYSEGDYFHLDIGIGWLRGAKLHRDVRFKFFRDKHSAGLEFRSIPGWPTMFHEWPGQLVDPFGPYFLISTSDAERSAIARLDQAGMVLVSDIAADLFDVISKLTNDPASKITDAYTHLREVIRFCEYIAARDANGRIQPTGSASASPEPTGANALAPSTAGIADGVSSTKKGDVPQLLPATLQPIAAMLQENQTLLKELQADPFTEKDLDILESYLAKIRRDGVPKHGDMKKKLDQLAENNTAIVALFKAYSPHAETAAFSSEGDRFLYYASAWRDRWNSLMEVFLEGGNYGESGAPFPDDFPAAVDAEIAAAR